MLKKSQSSLSEKRRAERLKFPLYLAHRLPRTSKYIQISYKNISGVGICLITTQPLRPKDKMEVMIKSKEMEFKPFYTLCEVVWSKPRAKGKFEVGLKFLKIKNAEEFTQFLCDKMLFYL